MKISTRGRYAVRSLLELAFWESEKPMMLGQIAKNQEIPEDYLVQIFGSLRRAGLVLSSRGSGGGFHLARRPEMITLADILEAAEGPLQVVPCTAPNHQQCKRSEACVGATLWKRINKEICDVLQNITLQEITQMEADRCVCLGDWHYQI